MGQFTLETIKSMALQGRYPISLKRDTCHPWYLADRWDVPGCDKYMATSEVDYIRFVALIVNAIERADRWKEFTIESIPGKAPEKGSLYRNSTFSLVLHHVMRVPNPTWKSIEDLRGELNMELYQRVFQMRRPTRTWNGWTDCDRKLVRAWRNQGNASLMKHSGAARPECDLLLRY